jgi:RNA polymerase sigma-32 factor
VTTKTTGKSRALAVPALSGEQSLNRYLSEIKKFPVLTAEQEYMLAKRFAEHEDPDAARQLVTIFSAALVSSCSIQRLASMYSSSLSSMGNFRICWR